MDQGEGPISVHLAAARGGERIEKWSSRSGPHDSFVRRMIALALGISGLCSAWLSGFNNLGELLIARGPR